MTAQLRSSDLDERVRQALVDHAASRRSSVLVLPTAVRSSGVWYALNDASTLKGLRHTGVDAQFTEDDPTYLHEYSAGWIADVSIAILGDVRSAAVGAIAAAMWLRARQAVKSGARVGKERDIPLRLAFTRHVVTEVGSDTKTLEIEGTTGEVIEALPEAARLLDPNAGTIHLPPPPPSDAELPPDDEQQEGD